MKILLDTHAFLWMVEGSDLLSPVARETILNDTKHLYLSGASYWEICIKLSLEKLVLSKGWESNFERELEFNDVRWLPIERSHCIKLSTLTFHHRDPFDRLLVSQAHVEELTVLTRDPEFGAYEVETIW